MATAIKLKTKPLECKPGTQSLNSDPSIRSQNDLKIHSSSLTAISHSYIFLHWVPGGVWGSPALQEQLKYNPQCNQADKPRVSSV